MRVFVGMVIGLAAVLSAPSSTRAQDAAAPTLWDAVRAARTAVDRGDAGALAATVAAPSKALQLADLVALTPAELSKRLRGVECTKGRSTVDPLDTAGVVLQVATDDQHLLFHGRVADGAARLVAVEELDPILFIESRDADRRHASDLSVAPDDARTALRRLAAALRERGGATEKEIRERYLATTFDLDSPGTRSAFGSLLTSLAADRPPRLVEVRASAPSAAESTFRVSRTRVTLVREGTWRIRAVVDEPEGERGSAAAKDLLDAARAVVAAINADDAALFARWALEPGRATPTPVSSASSRALLTEARSLVSGRASLDPADTQRPWAVPQTARTVALPLLHDGPDPLSIDFARTSRGWRLRDVRSLRVAETEVVHAKDVVPR